MICHFDAEQLSGLLCWPWPVDLVFSEKKERDRSFVIDICREKWSQVDLSKQAFRSRDFKESVLAVV